MGGGSRVSPTRPQITFTDFHQDERQPEGQQERIVRTPAVEGAHQEALHEQAEDARP